MRRTTSTSSVLLGLLAVGGGLWPVELAACGDKFLVIGRGIRRVQKARYPASIALYMPVGSALPAEAKEMRLEKTLKQAGHRVEAIAVAATLRERMASKRFDVVIADLDDARALERERGGADRPQIVPVAHPYAEGTAPAHYPLVIQPGKGVSYLTALDALMARLSSGPPR